MSSAAEQYTRELVDQFKFNATWTPGVPLNLGDIGVIDNGVFVPITSLDRFGVNLDATAENSGSESFSYASANAVEIGFKAEGEPSSFAPTIPLSDAGLGIQFKREKATVFQLEGATHVRIADEVALRDEVVSLMRANKWDKDWSIVTWLVKAASTTALISRSASSSIEFALSAGVNPGGIELLSVENDVRTVASREMQLTIAGSTNMTPLFRAKRVKRKWFIGRPELRAEFSAAAYDATGRAETDDDGLFDDDPPIYG